VGWMEEEEEGEEEEEEGVGRLDIADGEEE
jgi:hypothetical protein